jgi:hypothetical protein
MSIAAGDMARRTTPAFLTQGFRSYGSYESLLQNSPIA